MPPILRAKVLNAVDFIGIDGNDGIGQVLFQRQQCDGASVMEAFVSGMLVGKGMFHTADEHGSAVIVRISEEIPSCRRGLQKAAVCRQKQACSQDLPFSKMTCASLSDVLSFFDNRIGQNADIVG